MDALCLSLGHNSSAILIRDGKVLGGYEMERFTGIKADSQFPRLAIEELDTRFDIAPDVEIMIGHWALDGQLSTMLPKHWNPTYIKDWFPKSIIQTLDYKDFTHHDSHAFSAMAFAGEDFGHLRDCYIFVMDGFGTMGEHMSVYRIYDNIPVLQWRKFGFGTSLGLFFQYTTAYLGMKQNQDEYKLLAFEAHIDEAKSYIDEKVLEGEIKRWTQYYCDAIDRFETDQRTDPVLSLGALPAVAKQVADLHDSVLDKLNFTSNDVRVKRIIVSYFTQTLVERVVAHVINIFAPRNILLVGGLFYNVKLNNMISRMVPEKTCIMPLAGDQGAALGIYHAKYGLKWPGHLFWGHRDLNEVPKELPKGVMAFEDDYQALDFARDTIRKDGFVNIVRGAMEFGPRALCHTSTLARTGNKDIGDYINHLNNRTNEMPFAPVVSPGNVSVFFKDTDKIHKSLEYMIVTRDFNADYEKMNYAAAHLDADRNVYTGRPQIASEPAIISLVSDLGGILVNTSYNYHGVPIVNGWNQILHTHNMQLACADALTPTTIVVTGEVK